jgi:transposase
MEKINLRKVNNDEMYVLKKQVVRLKQLGKSGSEVEELTGINQSAVSRIWQAYQKGGLPAIKPKVSGRKKGSMTLLTPEESQAVRRAIIDKTPDQMKLGGSLWNRERISQYIKHVYGKTVSLRVISNYLKSWGLTCQRPTKRAYSQDDVRVINFKEREYPEIAKRAKAENADIYWGDETGVSNTANYERGFALKGQPPVLKVETRKEHISMISAITNKGSVRFMVYDKGMNQQLLIEFMSRMVLDSTRKIFLILDNLRVHHGKIVREWLEKNRDKIEVFYLPPYSPELNPDEYLNQALKRDVHSGEHPHTKDDLKCKVLRFMNRLSRYSDKVSAFFRHSQVRYTIAIV